jgi:Holliday junction resolvase
MKARGRRLKGKNGENKVMEMFLNDGFDVQKCDSSGSGQFDKADINLRFNDAKYAIEVKRHERITTGDIYNFLEESDILAFRKNRKKQLFVMDYETLAKLLLNKRS